VPIGEIDAATLLTLKGVFSSHQILGIRCKDKIYSFTLAEKLKGSFQFSFEVAYEEQRDHSETIFFGIILLIVVVIWFQFDIFAYFQAGHSA